jgi:hypothetical protein
MLLGLGLGLRLRLELAISRDSLGVNSQKAEHNEQNNSGKFHAEKVTKY